MRLYPEYEGAPSDGDLLGWDSGSGVWIPSANAGGIGLVVDGGGATITTGEKAYLVMPYAATLTKWSIVADQTGSIVIDVWKAPWADFPPTFVDSITGSNKPTLSVARKAESSDLSTWTTAVSAGDTLLFYVDSATAVQRISLTIWATKT